MANDETFYQHFSENMEMLGLRAPKSLFETAGIATATTIAIAKAVQLYGTKVTIGEILFTIPGVSAAVVIELGTVAVAVSAAFYVGACLGSLAVATGKTLSARLDHVDYVLMAHRLGIDGQWVTSTINEVVVASRTRMVFA